MGKQTRFDMFINSGEIDCSHGNTAGKSILGKRRIEEHWNKNDPLNDSYVPKLNKPNKNVHIPKLQKPVRPSAIRDFPPGCGRYASPVASESHISLSQKCLRPPVHIPKLQKPVRPSATRDFLPDCGRYASPVASESHIFLPQKCLRPPVSASGDYPSGYGRNVMAESSYISQHSSEQRSGTRKPTKVRHTKGNNNQLVNMIKKESSQGHSTINVEGLCSSGQKTNGNTTVASYKVVETPNKLCFKIIRTRPAEAPGKAVPRVEEPATRSKVRETLRSFQLVCRKILQIVQDPELVGKSLPADQIMAKLLKGDANVEDSKLKGKFLHVDQIAAKLLKNNNMYVNTGKQIVGAIPGLEVGDQFHYRIELCIVGLHRQVQAGIDFLKEGSVQVATSIVASGGYEDDLDGGDVLIYTGHGGNNYNGDKRQSNHQKLERGNLALKNSIDLKVPVRVIRGFKQKNTRDQRNRKNTVSVIYTYDGLYDVEKYWLDNGLSGYSVFKFQLRRQPGQPQLGLKTVQFAGRKKNYSIREGLRIKDISGGKEIICICAVNTVDEENGPPQFVYTTKAMYPSWCQPIRHRGCYCSDGCLNPSKCLCALKNEGEFPFNYDGAIVYSKPIVYECGPSCSCPPTCHNRVSQHGVRYNLEVFKTDKRGWGVRSSDSITSGSFICEYTGELLSDTEAEQCVGNDEYLFDIGRNSNSKVQSLCSHLYSLMPENAADATCDVVDDVGFTIDAAKYGNVGRFVNHSCSPNLYAQNVLYDHDDKRLPHIMLFAAENIPPMQELFYHYNCSVDGVYDCYGNIKKKPCLCGSSECNGRMY